MLKKLRDVLVSHFNDSIPIEIEQALADAERSVNELEQALEASEDECVDLYNLIYYSS